MQLENYKRSFLACKEGEEEEDLLIPIFNENETGMSIQHRNRSSLLQGNIETNLGRIEYTQNEMMGSGERRNTTVSINTKPKGIQQHRLRRSKTLRRKVLNTHKKELASIPIHVYDSLRVMVPSVASNKNASRVSNN